MAQDVELPVTVGEAQFDRALTTALRGCTAHLGHLKLDAIRNVNLDPMLAVAVRWANRSTGRFEYARNHGARGTCLEVDHVVDRFVQRRMQRVGHGAKHPPVSRGIFGFVAMEDGFQGVALAFVGALVDDRLQFALALALMCSLLFVAFWFFRLGFLADFLSRAVLIGFISGLGIEVFTNQVRKILGTSFHSESALMAAAGINWVVSQSYTESPAALLEAVELCLELGMDVNAVNSMGLTAVFGAANRGSDDIIELLVDHGARLDVADNEGRTPLDWAHGVFLATHPAEPKPSSIELIERLLAR